MTDASSITQDEGDSSFPSCPSSPAAQAPPTSSEEQHRDGNCDSVMDPTPQLRLEEAIASALTRDRPTTQFLTDQQGLNAVESIKERVQGRASKIRETLEAMEKNKDTIKTTPQIVPELLQQRRELTHIRDWQQRKQQWHRQLLQWRENILAGNLPITAMEFLEARRQHNQAYALHNHYIHFNQMPTITSMELVILAAYDPLLAHWRRTLPKRRRSLRNFTKPPAPGSTQ